MGALIIRIGFWCPLFYNYNKEPPQNSIGNLKIVRLLSARQATSHPRSPPEHPDAFL